jgi:ribose transport system ATP-binding protein
MIGDSSHSLEVVGLTKEYPGTVALQDVSVRFDGGRIHALLGKNGAGKSTLVKLLGGSIAPTAGSILVNGNPVRLSSPREALRLGIATVHQELHIVPGLTVAENLFLGRLPLTPRGLIDWTRTRVEASRILEDLGLTIDVRATAGTLGIAQQQLVEIARAMSFSPAALMLDEPTSALAHHETERLFELIKGLASRGVVILYITHRLEEIRRIADTVTVLRDGRLAGSLEIRDATPARIVRMMFGEAVVRGAPPPPIARREPVLELRELTRAGAFRNISFTLFEGEVLGIAGLLGSGRTELLRSIFGADPHDAGSIVVRGIPLTTVSPARMKELGVALTPENRKEEGLIQILSTRVNIALAGIRRIASHGIVTRAAERGVAERFSKELGITVPSVDLPVASLSGGNQQKVVIAKWLNINPRVLLLDEPTRGIDLQAKQQVFQIIRELSAKGISFIVVSSELEELLEICHRIVVMKAGELVGEMSTGESTLEALFAACVG